MGSRGQYLSSNRFTLYFESHYHHVQIIEGIKVLQFNDRPNSALPEYAKTSSAYFSINRDGEMQHLRIYKDHFPILDIDVGHPQHYGANSGFVHVHDFTKGKDGHPHREIGRSITATEMIKYSHLISIMKGTMK